MEYIVRFKGGLADQQLLPAFEGAQSIEGVSRSLTLVNHYLATGSIRKRAPFVSPVQICIEPPRRGSFEAIYTFIADPNAVLVGTAAGAITIAVFSNLLTDTIKFVFRRLTGSEHQPQTDGLNALLDERAGDLEALGEAVEPSLKKAHTVINNGAGNIFIVSGGQNVFRLDSRTKDFLQSSEIDDLFSQKTVSVGMLNANTRNGRVYDAELGRTVPIHIPREANARTIHNLARSLERYSAGQAQIRPPDVAIRYRLETAADGREKKYIVYDATIVTE